MRRILIIGLLGLFVGAGSVYAHQTTGLFRSLPTNQVTTTFPSTLPQVLGERTAGLLETKPEFNRPQRLLIPKLGVDTTVEHVGLDENQRMDVPSLDEHVAWYQHGPVPGELGSAVLAGHFDTRSGGPAVFYELNTLTVGDEVIVEDDQGHQRRFTVTQVATHSDNNFPIADVFTDVTGRKLNLITCAGQFDRAAQNYQDRLVVYTELQE